MRFVSIIVALLPALSEGVLRGLQARPPAAAAVNTTGLVCNSSTIARPNWPGDTYRDCNNRLVAAVGSLTTGDSSPEAMQGLYDFCGKCNTAYDAAAQTWRTACTTHTNWIPEIDKRIKKVSRALDGFGCSKTSAGDYCAKIYADFMKLDWPLPASCHFFTSCCYGLWRQWADVLNATMRAQVYSTCTGAEAAGKLTTC